MRVHGLVSHYVPPRHAGPARKVVLVLHGRGDSPAGFDWLPGALGQPQLGFLFLQAPDPYGPGFSWYDLPPHQGPGVLRSRTLLFGVLDQLDDQGVPPIDVLVFGFSQGCLMAVDLGLRYPRALGGVCGVSGYMMWPELAEIEATPFAKAMPWLITAGRDDVVVPFAQTEQHVHVLQAAGIPVTWRTYEKGHTIEPRHELADLRAWFAARLGEAR